MEWADDGSGLAAGRAQAGVTTTGVATCLDLHTPAEVRWARLGASVQTAPGKSLAAVQIVLRLDRVDGTGPARVDPMLALRPSAASDRRDGIPETRARLTLRPGEWYGITGLFRIPANETAALHDFILDLPGGYRVRIARLELDWVPAAATDSIGSGLEALLPFSAQMLDTGPEGPSLSVRRGCEPSLATLSQALKYAPSSRSRLAGHALLNAADAAWGVIADALSDSGKGAAGWALDRPAPSVVDALLADVLTGPDTDAAAQLDQLAFGTIAALTPPEQSYRPSAIRPLSVEIEGAPSDDDQAYWASLEDQGLIDAEGSGDAESAQRLTVSPGLRLSPAALAFLRSAAQTAGGGDILVVDPGEGKSSWKKQIVGYPQSGLPTAVAGRLSAADDSIAPGRFLLGKLDATGHTDGAARAAPAPENAYAIVVRMDAAVEVDHLTNIENCLVFDGLDAFRTALANAGPRVLAKPTFLLETGVPVADDRLIADTPRHWALGGRYVLTGARSYYDPETGQLKLTSTRRRDLARLVMRSTILTMSVSEALRPEVDDAVFTPEAGFAIVLRSSHLSSSDLADLSGLFLPEQVDPALHERLARAGSLDHSILADVPLAENWAAEPLISARLTRCRRMRHLLRSAARTPNMAIASEALTLCDPDSPDTAALDGEVRNFLMALSQAPAILLALPTERIVVFLDLAKRSPDGDGVARNLAIYADRLSGAHINVIAPLFELLALCLPPAELDIALSSTALRCSGASDRHVNRIAQALRRYGSNASLSHFLVSLHLNAPERLKNDSILRNFQSVLNSQLLPVVIAQVGPGLIRRIEASIDYEDRFRAAVTGGDRDAALILMEDAALGKVDFLRWMDTLRSLSNELRQMALPVADLAVPSINSHPRQRLASIVLSDMDALSRMDKAGLLDAKGTLNAVGLNILGRNDMLNELLADRFAGTDYSPQAIEGDSVSEVFAGAQASLAGLPVAGGREDGPRVTVIMSAFQPDIGLMRMALDSIEAQTHRNVEVMVIDDASPAASAADIRALVDEYDIARLIRLDVNSGPYVGRNLAMRQSSGEYVAIHDADDWAHPQRLAAQIAAFESDPQARLVTAEHIRIDRAGHVQLEGKFTIFGDGPMTSLFRRGVFDEIGEFACIRSRGDVEMRERLRSYYGHQAIHVLSLPMMLCLADTATLSQVTSTNKAEYLQLFRSGISRRRPLANMRREGRRLSARDQIVIPHTLRAPLEGLER